MKRIILFLALAGFVQADGLVMKRHDALTTVPVTVASGASTNGIDVLPLGASRDLSGWVTFSGAGNLTLTIQTRLAGKTTWYTPRMGATPLTAVAAGSYHIAIFVPPCEALRLVFTAAAADISVTEAFVLEQLDQ
jgi:hypothetical protein